MKYVGGEKLRIIGIGYSLALFVDRNVELTGFIKRVY